MKTITRLFGIIVLGISLGLVSQGTSNAAPGDQTIIANQLISTPDNGCPAWARDTFTRTTKITETAVVGVYEVNIADAGTISTGAALNSLEGHIVGGGDYTITGTLKPPVEIAAINGDTFDFGVYPCKTDVPTASGTNSWPLRFFEAGAINSGIDPWGWTYILCGESYTENSTPTPAAPGTLTGSACEVNNLHATNITASSIALAWDTDPDVAGYQLHRIGGGTVNKTTTSHLSSNLEPDTTYHFEVTPFDGDGNFGETAFLEVTTTDTVATPTASAGTVTRTCITVNWTQTPGANHWYLSRVGGGTGVLKTVRTHTSCNLQPNTVYTFRVRAAAGTGTNEVVSPAETINIRTKP